MTKGEIRKARKADRAAGRAYLADRAGDRPRGRNFTPPDEVRDDCRDTQIFSDTPRGQRALDRWARRNYDNDRD